MTGRYWKCQHGAKCKEPCPGCPGPLKPGDTYIVPTLSVYARGELVTELRRWSCTFKEIRSPDVAKLLASAADAIEAGRTDVALAAELEVCALTRDHLPEQSIVAQLMREARDEIGFEEGNPENYARRDLTFKMHPKGFLRE